MAGVERMCAWGTRRVQRWLGLAVLGCAAAVAAAEPPAATPEVDDPGCPSQDFAQFLRRFADPADDRVRLRYTADPLDYAVPAYAAASAGTLPATEVLRETGPARMKRLRASTLRAAAMPTPLPQGGQRVDFGDAGADGHYLFARRHGCWWLVRVSNPQG